LTFGENVKRTMKRKGIKQNELARKIGMSSSGISTALGENANPRENTIRAIAAGLNCTVGELMDEQPPDIQLTISERRLLDDFRSLNEQGQEYVLQTVYTVCASGIYKKPGNISGMESVTC